MSHVVAGGQSSESAEQEGGVQKIADVDTDKMEAPQDCDNSPEQPMKNQMDCPISIDSVTLLDGGSPIIKLRIKNLFSKNIAYAEVKYETLSPSTIKKCVTENGGMFQDWKNLLVTLLREIDMGTQYNLIPIIHGHTKVGWSENTNGIIFYHQNMTSQDNHNSQYMGKMDIKPKGELENIVNMIRRWILSTSEWSPLEAVIAFSISSVVLGYAKFAWGKVINNLVIHLVGDSTSGKTTSLRLHVGLGSNPYEEKYGFWLNHQSSIEAMIRKIGDNQGLPVGIDELSSARKKEYTDFIYTFGNGDEKDRLKAGGTGLCTSANFSTIGVLTGEVSILSKCSSNTGIRVRCVEFCNVKWTESKEQADAINDCLKDNYAWIPPLVAKELLNNSDKWKTRWNQIYKQVSIRMNKEKIRLAIGSRISEYLVLFTLAAEIANEVLGINLNVNEIFNFCYLRVIVANADEANLGERAYDYLLRYASENKREFPDVFFGTPVGSYCSNELIKGFFRVAKEIRIINGKEYRRQLVFFEDTYKDILKAGTFSPTVVSHELDKAHFLKTETGRYTCRLVYNGHRQNCYIIYCNDEDDLMFEAMADGTWNPDGEEEYKG